MAILIEDTFTAADATTLAGRTPSPTNTPGNTYVAEVGSGTVVSNAATFGAASSRFGIQSGISDAIVSINGKIGTSSTRVPRLFFRGNGNVAGLGNGGTNLWYIDPVGGAGGAGSWNMIEVSAGTSTTRATVAATVTQGQVYLMEVRMNGTALDFYVDSVLTLSFTSSVHQTRTIHGFGCGVSVTAVTVDDFTVQDIAVVAGQPLIKRFGGIPFLGRSPHNIW